MRSEGYICIIRKAMARSKKLEKKKKAAFLKFIGKQWPSKAWSIKTIGPRKILDHFSNSLHLSYENVCSFLLIRCKHFHQMFPLIREHFHFLLVEWKTRISHLFETPFITEIYESSNKSVKLRRPEKTWSGRVEIELSEMSLQNRSH